MAQAEMVTVRMSRGQMGTPWGFDIGPELAIINVIGGSLADRAGLLNGDVLVELEGHQNLNIELAKQLLSKTKHKVELIVHRTGGNITHRIWQPSVTENTEYNKFQHSVFNVASTDAKKMELPNIPLKVSLEHQNPESIAIPGFNVTVQPFGDHQEVKHLQYNSPMPLYSPQTAAEQYLQQTGGLFGTDPNLAKQKEVPLYLRSETLRLIQESERSKEKEGLAIPVKSTEANQEEIRSNAENISEIPMCFICGRNIKGVMCRAHDHTMHGDCFQCSTCGNSLKNQGYHFINDKFYCDIHGCQLKGSSDIAKRDEIHWSAARRPKIVLTSDKNTSRTSYQPEIMTRQSVSISPTPWKTQSPISPSNRGVPPAATQYGQELNELKKEIYNSSKSSGNVSDQQSHQTSRMLNRVPSLPLEIQKVTSPRRLACKHHWPPESHKIKKYWQCSFLIGAAFENLISSKSKQDATLLPLSKFIRENEDKWRKPPSSKRYLLKGEQLRQKNCHWKSINDQKNRIIENNFCTGRRYHMMPCDIFFRNPNYSEYMKQRKRYSGEFNCSIEEMHKINIEGLTDSTNSRICSSECYNYCLMNIKCRQQQQHIQNKLGLISILQNTDYERTNSEIRKHKRKEYEKKEQNLDESDIKMMDISMKMKNLLVKVNGSQELPNAIESPNVIIHCNKIGNIGLNAIEKKGTVAETEANFITDVQGAQLSQNITVNDLLHSDKNRSKGTEKTTCNVFDVHVGNQLIMEGVRGKIGEKKKHRGVRMTLKNVINRFLLKVGNQQNYVLYVVIRYFSMEDKLMDKNGCCQKQKNARYPGTSKVIKVLENWSNSYPDPDVNRNSYIKSSNVHELQNDELAKNRGVLHAQSNRAPCCEDCRREIRSAYVLANGLAYCPDHFVCSNKRCGRKLLDTGFVEEKGYKYCERCFETEIAPRCAKCNQPITADCLNALQKQWHPHCFVCTHCHNPFGNSAFFLEQEQPYCETGKLIIFNWNTLFTTKCVSCHYPIEAGDRWVEALGAAFHSNCFNCTSCNVNLEGESFYAKNGAPYCKLHA